MDVCEEYLNEIQDQGPPPEELDIAALLPKAPQPTTSHEADSPFATRIDPMADEMGNPPCYLPQPNDILPSKDHLKPMGPIGPWATGKVDWSPLAGLTGTRPVVDRYSITRFSPNEWRAKNMEVLRKNMQAIDDTNKNQYSIKTTLMRTNALVDKTQKDTTESVRSRAKLIGKWKRSLEEAITAMADEISTMEEQRIRLKQSLVVFGKPESIVKECLLQRCGRAETELVRDVPEEELVKELALIAEIRRLLNKTLEDFEQQQIENRTARQRLEYDWSDKKEAYHIDCMNVGLHNNSPTIMYHPGAVRQPPEQASEQYWEHFSKETLEECEKTRQKSVKLRQTLNSILMNAARDLRTQADTVEGALTARINCTQQNITRFTQELRDCLQRMADTEKSMEALRIAINRFDSALKVAQTRMHNRGHRPNVENCRDAAQQDLIDEVHTIQSSITALLAEMDEASRVKNDLMICRSNLEREIMLKRNTLLVDRDRCMVFRSHYPSASALSGFTSL